MSHLTNNIEVIEDGCSKETMANNSEMLMRPSAPPLTDSIYKSIIEQNIKGIMNMGPPHWMPDSQADTCIGCDLSFLPGYRHKHHCRLCGNIYCNSCSHHRKLLPPRYLTKDLQRVCDSCAVRLDPYQKDLMAMVSRACQYPVHDSLNWSSPRSWINSPFFSTMEADIYKATNILNSFNKVLKITPEKISDKIFSSAEGIAIFSQIKMGLGIWSCQTGTGLILSRLRNGNWSAPCSVGLTGIGWGIQTGGAIMDMIIILYSVDAVKSFAENLSLSLSGTFNLTFGVGSETKANINIGKDSKSLCKCYAFGFSKGAFAGISLEGTILKSRNSANSNFYGKSVTVNDILYGENGVMPPVAAVNLYDQLEKLFPRENLDESFSVVNNIENNSETIAEENTYHRKEENESMYPIIGI